MSLSFRQNHLTNFLDYGTDHLMQLSRNVSDDIAFFLPKNADSEKVCIVVT